MIPRVIDSNVHLTRQFTCNFSPINFPHVLANSTMQIIKVHSNLLHSIMRGHLSVKFERKCDVICKKVVKRLWSQILEIYVFFLQFRVGNFISILSDCDILM